MQIYSRYNFIINTTYTESDKLPPYLLCTTYLTFNPRPQGRREGTTTTDRDENGTRDGTTPTREGHTRTSRNFGGTEATTRRGQEV